MARTSPHTLPRGRSCRTGVGGRLGTACRRSYVLPPEVLVAEILRLFVGDQVVVDFSDVDGTVELTPETVEKMRLLLDALLPGLEVMRQVRRQVPLEHLVAHVNVTNSDLAKISPSASK